MVKKNKILIGCLALLLVLSVGYALFSETIKINGTATAKGNFSIKIECKAGDGYGNVLDSCTVKGNNVTTTSILTKPGEYIYYELKITNNGTIPMKLKKIVSPNNLDANWENEGDCYYLDKSTYLIAYYIDYNDGCDSEFEALNLILEPGESKEFDIIHEWMDSDYYFGVKQPALPNGEASITYDLSFYFEQVTN